MKQPIPEMWPFNVQKMAPTQPSSNKNINFVRVNVHNSSWRPPGPCQGRRGRQEVGASGTRMFWCWILTFLMSSLASARSQSPSTLPGTPMLLITFKIFVFNKILKLCFGYVVCIQCTAVLQIKNHDIRSPCLFIPNIFLKKKHNLVWVSSFIVLTMIPKS